MLRNDSEIVHYFIEKYPEEGCGLLLNRKGKLEWFPCNNVAEDPEETFVIDSNDYVKASLMGDIHAIVHSHPDGTSELSEADKKASDFLGIPYIVYSIPDLSITEYIPERKVKPLLGRDYKFGENDCYSLVRDYYLQEFNITLPSIVFEDDWWDKGLNYFEDLVQPFGFVGVDEPQKGDMIIFKVFCHVPNHCGIYLGEELFMHHAIDRLSCRENLYPLWKRHVVRYIRYAKS